MSKALIWQAYAAALGCDTHKEVQLALGLSDGRYTSARKEEPEIDVAIEAAWKRRSSGLASSLGDDEHLVALWDQFKTDDAGAKQRALMAIDGQETKQRLYLYALTQSHFDSASVCRKLKISRRELAAWADDPLFAEIADELEHRRKDFVESALMQKIAEGSEKAIIHANATLNKDRGYALGVEVSGQVNHVHGVIDLMSLDIPIEAQAAIVEAIQGAGLLDVDGLVVEPTSLE